MNKFCLVLYGLGKFSSGSLLEKRLEQVLLLFLLQKRREQILSLSLWLEQVQKRLGQVLSGSLLQKRLGQVLFGSLLQTETTWTDKFCPLVLYSRNDFGKFCLVLCSTGIGSKFCLVSYPHLKAQSPEPGSLLLESLQVCFFYSLMRDVLSVFIVFKACSSIWCKRLVSSYSTKLDSRCFVWLPTHMTIHKRLDSVLPRQETVSVLLGDGTWSAVWLNLLSANSENPSVFLTLTQNRRLAWNYTVRFI